MKEKNSGKAGSSSYLARFLGKEDEEKN